MDLKKIGSFYVKVNTYEELLTALLVLEFYFKINPLLDYLKKNLGIKVISYVNSYIVYHSNFNYISIYNRQVFLAWFSDDVDQEIKYDYLIANY